MKCYACRKDINTMTEMKNHPDVENAVVFYCKDCWNPVKEKARKMERMPCFLCKKAVVRYCAVESYKNGTVYVVLCKQCHRNEMIRSICSKVKVKCTSWRLKHLNILLLRMINHVTDRLVNRFPGASIEISIGIKICIQYPEHLDEYEVENIISNAMIEWIKKNT